MDTQTDIERLAKQRDELLAALKLAQRMLGNVKKLLPGGTGIDKQGMAKIAEAIREAKR